MKSNDTHTEGFKVVAVSNKTARVIDITKVASTVNIKALYSFIWDTEAFIVLSDYSKTAKNVAEAAIMAANYSKFGVITLSRFEEVSRVEDNSSIVVTKDYHIYEAFKAGYISNKW